MAAGQAIAVLEPLEELARAGGVDALADRLGGLGRWVAADLAAVERALGGTAGPAPGVHDVVHHLLDVGGKRLRPVCVALAARAGHGFGPAALELAVAVELVHNATLMHDDVVDLGDRRRGRPTARLVYGNAASIFAGDYLLVDALRRIRFAGVTGALEKMLATIEEMIVAEMRQLRARGRPSTRLEDYLAVAEGKTAALFRWGLWAGGRAGGLGTTECAALERYGARLGVAFQVVDDVLDLDGDPATTGKSLGQDLREGKMTHPILVAAARDPSVAPSIERLARAAPEAHAASEIHALRTAVRATGALEESRAFARAHVNEAIAALDALPRGFAREALALVAEAALGRRK